MAVEQVPMVSSWIESATFDDSSGVMNVTLKNGRTLTTDGITPEFWEDFKSAESPGRFYRTMIQGRSR